MARFYSDDKKKEKKRPQLKSKCQLKRVLTISREAAEKRELAELAAFRESQGEEITDRHRKR